MEWARPSEYSKAIAIAVEKEREGLMGLLYLQCCPCEAVSYCRERAWFAASKRVETYFLERATSFEKKGTS